MIDNFLKNKYKWLKSYFFLKKKAKDVATNVLNGFKFRAAHARSNADN